MSRFYRSFLLMAGLICSASAWGLETRVSLLMDSDNDAATGCSVNTVVGPMNGVEFLVDAFIETDNAGSSQITATGLRACVDPSTNTFGPLQALGGSGDPVGTGAGVDGFNVVEIGLPSPFGDLPEGGLLRLGITSSNELGDEFALLTTAPGGSEPILLNIEALAESTPLSVPAGGAIALFILVAGFLLLALRARRIRGVASVMLLALSGGLLAQAYDFRFDWTNGPLAETAATVPDDGVDVRAFFAQANRSPTLELAFRFDMALTPEPSAILEVEPANLEFDANGTGTLTVTNRADSPVEAQNVTATIPSGSGITIQNNACPVSLAIGTSCDIDLTASAPETATPIDVGGDNSNTVTVPVTVVLPPAELSVNGSPLTLTVNGPTGNLTITNDSTLTTATNVGADFAGTALDGNVTETGNTCANVAPGGSCTLTFTPGNTVVPETSFPIQGDNTAVVTAAIEIESGSTLIAVNPTSGPSAGGTGVTLTGTSLTGATSVSLDGIAASSVNVVNSTTVTAVTPAHAAGVVDIVVDTPAGGATLASGFTYVATAVGQASGGGTIACLDGGLQNLIGSTADNSTGIEWGGFGTAVGGGAQSSTDGATNTATIVAALGNNGGTPYAAQLCNDFEVDSQGNVPCQAGNTCYNDWFLPAQDQLNCLFNNRAAIGGFASGNYWSSTESSGDPTISAWSQSFLNGAQFLESKANVERTRCVRGFTP